MVMGLAGLVACGPKGTTEQVASDPFEQIYGSPEQNRRREIRVQKKVRECMVLLGWEYTPVDQGSFTYTEADMARDREQFGYGISTYIGNEDIGTSFQPDVQTNPNDQYVQTLSEGEQTAYYEDLYGPPYEGEEPYDPATARGCENEARRAVYGDDPFSDPEIQEDLNKVYEATTDDPRLAKAEKKWSKCMQDKDFDYTKQEEIYTDLQQRLDKIMGSSNEGGFSEDPFTTSVAVEGEFSEFSGDGFDDGSGGAPSEPSYDKKALAALQALELAIAARDFECSQQHLVPLQREIAAEAVDALLAEHPELGNR
jgi:hypothetical protein